MSKSVKTTIVLLLLAASVGLFLYNRFRIPPTMQLSEIVIEDVNGTPVNIESLKGKPIVINFWGTWCGPCVYEMPMFKQMTEKYKGKVHFLFVSDETKEKVMAFERNRKFGLNYYFSGAFSSMGIHSIPVTYFFKPDGSLHLKNNGVLDENAMNAIISEIL